jgi:hypothetical protein
MIFAAGGAGSLAGAYLAPRGGRRLGPAGTMVSGLALLVVHQVVGDGGRTIYDIHDRTWRQTAVPPEALARADAGVRTLEQVATLAGALAGGALATLIGARLALVLSASLFLLATVLFLVSSRRRGFPRA